MEIAEKTLTSLPNIGKVLAEQLIIVGILTPKALKMTGAENAFIKILSIDDSSCFNKLCALEGAIQGIRWHDLDESRKEQLKEFFREVKGIPH